MQNKLFALIIGIVCYCSLVSCATTSNSTDFGEDIYAEDGMSYDSGKSSELGYVTGG